MKLNFKNGSNIFGKNFKKMTRKNRTFRMRDLKQN